MLLQAMNALVIVAKKPGIAPGFFMAEGSDSLH
jgi:hypothetical protein